MAAEQYDVFISHAGEDKNTIAIPLCDLLKGHGFSVFLDVAELRVGDDAPECMIKAMETAQVGVFVLSPEFAAKKWPMRELQCFLRRQAKAAEVGGPSPLLVPIFYRLGIEDCCDASLFERCRAEDGRNLFGHWGFFERARAGETGIKSVMDALGSISRRTGVEQRCIFENTGEATNEQSEQMAAEREKIVSGACKGIVHAVYRRIKLGSTPSETRRAGSGEIGSASIPDEEAETSSDNFTRLPGACKYPLVVLIILFTVTLGVGLTLWSRDVGESEGAKGARSPGINNLRGSTVFSRLVQIGRELRRGCSLQGLKEGQNLGCTFSEGLPNAKRDQDCATLSHKRTLQDSQDVEAKCRPTSESSLSSGSEAPPASQDQTVGRCEDEIANTHALHAMIELGTLLAEGGGGIEPDVGRSVTLLENAVSAGGGSPAINNLAVILAKGSRGVKPDSVRADALFERAIQEAGNQVARSAAKCNLGVLVETGGPGLKRDPERAKSLYEELVHGGLDVAETRRQGLLLLDEGQCVKNYQDGACSRGGRGACEGDTLWWLKLLSVRVWKSAWGLWMQKLGWLGGRWVLLVWMVGRLPQEESFGLFGMVWVMGTWWWLYGSVVTDLFSGLYGEGTVLWMPKHGLGYLVTRMLVTCVVVCGVTGSFYKMLLDMRSGVVFVMRRARERRFAQRMRVYEELAQMDVFRGAEARSGVDAQSTGVVATTKGDEGGALHTQLGGDIKTDSHVELTKCMRCDEREPYGEAEEEELTGLCASCYYDELAYRYRM